MVFEKGETRRSLVRRMMVIGLALIPFVFAASGLCFEVREIRNFPKFIKDNGHTDQCHINKRWGELSRRIEHGSGACRTIGDGQVASAFSGMGSAVSTIKSVLEANERKITQWLGGSGSKLVLKGTGCDGGIVVSKYEGRRGKNRNPCATKKGGQNWVCKRARKHVVVLKKSGGGPGFHVLTAYPMP